MDRERLLEVEAELEARFGRPLTDEERAHLHAASAPPAEPPAASAEAAYGSVRRPTGESGSGASGPAARAANAPASQPRTGLRRITGPLVAGGLAVAKWSALIFKLKFLGLFVSIGVFQFLWHSWWLAIGFIGLIFVHEAGHMLEARRQGLPVSWPQFVPLLGAYVTLKHLPANAWRSALVAIAGPGLGSLGAAACWIAAEATGSPTLKALAHLGFFVNLVNLAPLSLLDGRRIVDALDPALWLGVIGLLGVVAALIHNGILILVLIVSAFEVWGRWKSQHERARNPYYAIGHARTAAVAIAYVGLAALLVAGMHATNIPRR